MSSPSMTLKCGSVKSFFIAALRTSAPTPERMKGWKSDSGVSARTSSSVGKGALAMDLPGSA